MDISVDRMLTDMVKLGASDLHISAYNPPIIRLNGKLMPLKSYPILSRDLTETIIINILTGDQNQKLIDNKEIDLSYFIRNVARFRGNIFLEQNSVGAVFRMIPHKPEPLDQLGVPPMIKEIALKHQGLFLVTGPSGSGKTTTLASMVDYMNNNRNAHIVTIEDPIEYVFGNRSCLIRQRQVGLHTLSFAHALKSVLRQDPDVILVGEMRDRETIETALIAAETGHLIMSTLHTNNAVDSVRRILDVFTADSQNQVQVQLAATLIGVFSQQLLPSFEPDQRSVLATEVLLVTPAVRNMIREGKIHMIRNAIETGSDVGMQTMEFCLAELYLAGKITYETAATHAFEPEVFQQIVANAEKRKKQISVQYTGKTVASMAPKPQQKATSPDFGKSTATMKNPGVAPGAYKNVKLGAKAKQAPDTQAYDDDDKF